MGTYSSSTTGCFSGIRKLTFNSQEKHPENGVFLYAIRYAVYVTFFSFVLQNKTGYVT